MFRDMLKERHDSPETQHGDFLDQIANDMDKEKFLSEDFSVQLVFGGLFATFESISAVLALAFSLLSDNPSVLQELTVCRQSLSNNFNYPESSIQNFIMTILVLIQAEHEAIVKNREDPNSPLTWDEYKSMTFTLQVCSTIFSCSFYLAE